MNIDTVSLDRNSRESLSSQFARQLRSAITSGSIKSGQRLPSSRSSAAAHGISRNTVADAYAQLISEGFAVSRAGSGTYVAQGLAATASVVDAAPPSGPARLSRRGEAMVRTSPPVDPLTRRPVLAPGVPATDLFPRERWARAIARGGRQAAGKDVEDDPLGWRPLRIAIADHIGPSRGVACHPDQIMIFDGARSAIELMLKLLTDPGDRAWLEDPGYTEARHVISHNGVEVVPVPCDAEGLMVAQGERAAPSARLAYVTPAHQYPSGVIMSARRRLDLLAWAGRSEAWIIEDDYDGEFRHRGSPTATLASIDRSHRVIHMGTFSKSMFPALRLAYLVLPPALVDPAASLRFALSGHTGVTAQRGLAEFIISGQFASHVRAMRKVYGERQHALLAAVDLHFGDSLKVGPDDTGLHITGEFAAPVAQPRLAAALTQSGVGANPLSAYFAVPQGCAAGLVVGYAGWPEKVLEEGVRLLAAALAEA